MLMPHNNQYPITIGGITLPVEPSEIDVSQEQDWEIRNIPGRDGSVKQPVGLGDVTIMIKAYIDPEVTTGTYKDRLHAAFSKVITMFQESKHTSLPIIGRLPGLMGVKRVIMLDFDLKSAGGRSTSMTPYTLSLRSDDGSSLKSLSFVNVKEAFRGRLTRLARATGDDLRAMGATFGAEIGIKTPEQWSKQFFGTSKVSEFVKAANSTYRDSLSKEKTEKGLFAAFKMFAGQAVFPAVISFKSPFYSGFTTVDPLSDGPWLTTGSKSIFVDGDADAFEIMDSVYGKGAGRIDAFLKANPGIDNPMSLNGWVVTVPPLVSADVAHAAKMDKLHYGWPTPTSWIRPKNESSSAIDPYNSDDRRQVGRTDLYKYSDLK